MDEATRETSRDTATRDSGHGHWLAMTEHVERVAAAGSD